MNYYTIRIPRFEVEEELKKNNAELAKSLNDHKEALAQIVREKAEYEREIMDLKVELSQLRGSQDPAEVEAEIGRRVREEMGRMEQELRSAVDHTLGLSTILGRLVATSSQSKRASDVGGIRVRQVVTGRPVGGTSWAKGGQGRSPPRQLSKVSPMVAGNAISRPRIQLERMDLSLVQLPTEQAQEDPTEERGSSPLGNSPAIVVTEAESPTSESATDPTPDNLEEEEEIEPTPPPPPGRNPFDLTNIREESMMEDTVNMEETLATPSMEVLQEEEFEDVEEERPGLLTSTTLRQSTRLSVRPEVVSPGQSPAIPSTSPYVLAADEVEATPGTSRALVNNSVSLTESFLTEQMVDIDPTEGPSWLFASVKKKKKRKAASKKLSAIFSDLDVSSTSNVSSDASGSFRLADHLEAPVGVVAALSPENQENESSDPAGVFVREQADRTPLSPLTQHRDDNGHMVNILEPRVLLSNVGVETQEAEASSSPIGKGKRTLDELFSLVRDASPPSVCPSPGKVRYSKRKCSSDPRSEQHDTTRNVRAKRATEPPRLQSLEVRLEKIDVLQDVGNSSAETDVAREGRAKRNRSQVSYKEPSLGKKLRQVKFKDFRYKNNSIVEFQGDQVSNIMYDNNFKTELKKPRKKPKIKNQK